MKKTQLQIRLSRHFGMKLMGLFSTDSRAKQKIIQKLIDHRLEERLKQWTEEKKFCFPGTVSSAAMEMETTPEELTHHFKTTKKTNFTAWRTELRIREACRILEEDASVSLREVRGLVGIPDKSNFRRAFKNVTGMTPMEWISEKEIHISSE